MVDPGATYPDNYKYRYWIYWNVINNNQEAAEFVPPNPYGIVTSIDITYCSTKRKNN
ncbi:MAG: hypothetical protein QW303_02720 [Nitrososphaerota archaeon]